MKWSFAAIGIFMLGLLGLSIIFLFQKVTTNNENDYYLLKEITEAAMVDAIDVPYYRETGNLKIVREKFVENFTRRFAESTIFITNKYIIKSYDIMEMPPKVSVIIDTGLGEYTVGGNASDYNIANRLDAILEFVGKNTNVNAGSQYYDNPYVEKTYSQTYYGIVLKDGESSNFNILESLKVPDEIVAPNIKNAVIKSVKMLGDKVNTQGELNQALLWEELSYYNAVNTDYMQKISDYANDITNSNIDFHNCGLSTSTYSCDETNKYWVSIRGNTDVGKEKVIFKYEVVWSYLEYEFSN